MMMESLIRKKHTNGQRRKRRNGSMMSLMIPIPRIMPNQNPADVVTAFVVMDISARWWKEMARIPNSVRL